VSITCSRLQIRRRWVHVPHSILSEGEGMESETGTPMSCLQRTTFASAMSPLKRKDVMQTSTADRALVASDCWRDGQGMEVQ
jgi:hypothetical protein